MTWTTPLRLACIGTIGGLIAGYKTVDFLKSQLQERRFSRSVIRYVREYAIQAQAVMEGFDGDWV